jgi:hypothetical protein
LLTLNPMDANSGEPWSEADISDLKNELDHGRTVEETAVSLRLVGTIGRPLVRFHQSGKKELGLVENTGKRRAILQNRYSHRVISRIGCLPPVINRLDLVSPTAVPL